MIDISNDLRKCMKDEDITIALAKCVVAGTLPVDDLTNWLNYGTLDLESLEKAKFITPEQQKANKMKNLSASNESAKEIVRRDREDGTATKKMINFYGTPHDPREVSMSTNHNIHEAFKGYHSAFKEAVPHHAALSDHFSGKKPLNELDVKRHQKALLSVYDKVLNSSK